MTAAGERNSRKDESLCLEQVSPSSSCSNWDGHLHMAFNPGDKTHRWEQCWEAHGFGTPAWKSAWMTCRYTPAPVTDLHLPQACFKASNIVSTLQMSVGFNIIFNDHSVQEYLPSNRMAVQDVWEGLGAVCPWFCELSEWFLFWYQTSRPHHWIQTLRMDWGSPSSARAAELWKMERENVWKKCF